MDTFTAERERLRALIEHYEDLEKRAKEALPHLRMAYAALNGSGGPGDSVATEPPKSSQPQRSPRLRRTKDRQTFKPKYEKSSKELAYDLLFELGTAMTVNEVREELKRRGFEFSDPAVAYSLTDLYDKKRVKKLRAPKGTHARWVYKATGDRPAPRRTKLAVAGKASAGQAVTSEEGESRRTSGGSPVTPPDR